MDVYIDESGDLGFSSKSTSFFVVAYLILEHHPALEKIMKRLLKLLHNRREYARRCNELKFSKSRNAVKQKVLSRICLCDMKIGFIVLEKKKVRVHLRNSPKILYNYVIVDQVMRNILPSLKPNDKLNITIDKSLSSSSRKAFNSYTINKASWLVTVQKKEYSIKLPNIEVHHRNSQNEPCLQVADFLAGACFQKYEHNNDFFYKMVEDKVEYFKYLWK